MYIGKCVDCCKGKCDEQKCLLVFSLQDALYREQMLENKLATLQRLISNSQALQEDHTQVRECLDLQSVVCKEYIRATNTNIVQILYIYMSMYSTLFALMKG